MCNERTTFACSHGYRGKHEATSFISNPKTTAVPMPPNAEKAYCINQQMKRDLKYATREHSNKVKRMVGTLCRKPGAGVGIEQNGSKI
jgi:hypothetical protein